LEANALTKCSIGLIGRDQIGVILSRLDAAGAIRLLEELNVAWSAMLTSFTTDPSWLINMRLIVARDGLMIRAVPSWSLAPYHHVGLLCCHDNLFT
jgi:hypothetical protein